MGETKGHGTNIILGCQVESRPFSWGLESIGHWVLGDPGFFAAKSTLGIGMLWVVRSQWVARVGPKIMDI